MKYDIIYADPPWDYKGQKQHAGASGPTTGGAIAHYPTMVLKDLKQLPIANLCNDNALLFMWTSSPHLDQAIDLMPAWGFKYVTVAFVWDKMRVNPGYYTMSQCELVILGKRGKIPTPRGQRNVRQYVQQKRGRHSAKPNEIRKRIVEMFPTQKKLELFARVKTDGWHTWGNEIENDIEVIQ
jgi:N6-adenosine-specific RNA methylase IME4